MAIIISTRDPLVLEVSLVLILFFFFFSLMLFAYESDDNNDGFKLFSNNVDELMLIYLFS